MKLTFIELPQFTRLVTEVTDDRFLIQLQNTLIKNPEAGALIPRLHGLRKVRMALQGKSRSEGARVIYLHLQQHQAIIFFYLYTKAASSNLQPSRKSASRPPSISSSGSTDMKTKDVKFVAADLVGSVEAFARHLQGKHKLTLRTTTAPLPPPVKALTPAQVRSIRRKLNVSQPVFAALMNIPTVTLASWERGRRKPTGAALRMLDIARRHPEILVTQ